MNLPHLFSPLKVGPYQLKHRVMMAPLTPYERKTFYGGNVAGYTNYPACDAMAPA
jgi:2,4-dienoyl-CoA reductase-like NADH-dependent reductase (Old Yellow Enzyme family)